MPNGLTETDNTETAPALKKEAFCSDGRTDILFIPPELNPVLPTGTSGFIPAGLLSLSACLRTGGFEPKIYKPWIRLFHLADYREAAADILNFNPKIIGFSTWCNSYPASLILAGQIKQMDPTIPVVFGGPQATILAVETLSQFSFVDYILSGEADFTVVILVKALLNGKKTSDFRKIEGLVFRNKKGQVVSNRAASGIPDLGRLPFPAFDLLCSPDVVKLDAGRGCPFKCTYCTTGTFFSSRYRTKPVERIIREMELAAEVTGTGCFSITHDMFTLNRRFIRDFCTSLSEFQKKTGKNFTWSCSSRIDSVTEEMLIAMRKAGCRAIFFGIESGSPKVQQKINKNLHVRTGLDIADTCRMLGIDLHASFIVGFPFETKEDLEDTLRCLLEFALRGSFTQLSQLSLLPGTPLYNEYRENLVYDGQISNFSHTLCSRAETEIISKYPALFSSFYHLPADTMDRESMLILCGMINHSGKFRNTIFLLRQFIREDLSEKSLLGLFSGYADSVRQKGEEGYPLVTAWIGILKKYLHSKINSGPCLPIWDVFIWEATRALLQSRFLSCRLIAPAFREIKPGDTVPGNYNNVVISPYWEIITTSYNLPAIIPSQNGWKTENPGKNRGVFHYLLTTRSEEHCHLERISAGDASLIRKLQGKRLELSDKNITPRLTGKVSERRIAKMTRLGVLGINETIIT